MEEGPTRSRIPFAAGIAIGVVGLLLAVPAAHLVLLGGSAYYLLCAGCLLACGVLTCRDRPAGDWLFVMLVAASLAWAWSEIGLDGWAILPRMSLFLPLGAILAGTRFWQAGRSSQSRRQAVGLTVSLMALGTLCIVPPWIVRPERPLPFPVADRAAAPLSPSTDWPFVGGDAGSTRYAAAAQITPANVGRLKLAWETHLGFPKTGMGVLEGTPLMVAGTLFMCNTQNEIIALDPDSGQVRWRFDPRIDRAAVILGVCRGVAYYSVPHGKGLCAKRIIAFTLDGRMFALDAESGRRCPAFGANGEVDLTSGMGAERGYYSNTSAPAIVRGRIIVGGFVLDVQHVGEASGAIRAFDAVTGRFSWAWDMGRPGEHGAPPAGQTYTLGTPNAWAPITGDDRLGLAFIPLGNATPDYVSGHRTAAMNQYTDALVALDAETGTLRWSFQTTHRDVWDYDNASPPTLADFPTARGMVKAVIQPTKRGQFFVLDRQTGRPLVETRERRVPTDAAPGEQVSPTQPYATGMPSFAGDGLTEADMWGMTAFDQLWCRIRFREAHYEGEMTPIGLEPTIVYPGYLGGSEWGGVSVDPLRHLMVVNVNHFAMLDQLLTRSEADRARMRPYRVGGPPISKGDAPQAGTPYAARTAGFVTPLDTPCIRPPYSELAVVDLSSRKVLWRQPLGTARDSGPGNLHFSLPVRMGVPAVGGPLLTRSGLIFIAATQERSFRAFDQRDGHLLWQARLPAGGHAAPMTYVSPRTGRQYVLIPASGHFWMKSGSDDRLLAYALPS